MLTEEQRKALNIAATNGYLSARERASIRELLAASAAPAEGREPTGSPNLTIEEGPRDGNWRTFRVNGHRSFIRIVARMEEDEQDLPLGKQVAQFLLTASAKSVEGQEPVGIIECDEANGWHMNALVDWEKIWIGTKLYADKYACGTAWMLGGRKSNTPAQTEQWNAPCKQCSTPRACLHIGCRADATQPAESKRVELTDEEIDAVWDSVPWKDLNVASLEHVTILRRRFARDLLARASAKGDNHAAGL